MSGAVGLLLAAGSGSRMGQPKALVAGAGDEPWVQTAARALHEGGCERVTVVGGGCRRRGGGPCRRPAVGRSRRRRRLVARHVGLAGRGAGRPRRHATRTAPSSAWSTPRTSGRRSSTASSPPRARRGPALGRAAYGGVPGHPVVLGREHWAGTLGMASGDRGARDYLGGAPGPLVECADLASGRDVDTHRVTGRPATAAGAEGAAPAAAQATGLARCASALSAPVKHCSGGVTRPAPTWPVPGTRPAMPVLIWGRIPVRATAATSMPVGVPRNSRIGTW